MNGFPFFIIGSARSGTTLLRLMLNAHPGVAVPPESRFITELSSGTSDVDVSDFIGRLASHKQFATWDLPIEAVENEIEQTGRIRYADAIAATYIAYARVHGKSRWGDKTPRYVEHIPEIAALFPDARFVHLVRDGRNVALSYADVPFGPKTVGSAARLWRRRVLTGREHGRALGEHRYLELRYEDLVEDAEGRTKALCEFLHLDFDAGMLDYTERARDAVLDRAERYNPHVMEKPITRTRSWEKDMAPALIEVFEAVAGDALALLEYPRRHPDPSTKSRLIGALSRDRLPFARLPKRGR
jgi:hypothetical protein